MDPNPVVLFRGSLAEDDELEAVKRHFEVIETRAAVQPYVERPGGQPCTVIPRYSALPFYQELEQDLHLMGAELINTYRQHCYVADLKNWYHDLQNFTPKTWFRPEDVPMDQPGSFVLKGATNSKKSLWRTHMFAPTRADVMSVYCNLLDDTFISQQDIYVRQWERFTVADAETLNGLPVTNEWRFFVLDGHIIGEGFYWSEHADVARDLWWDDAERARWFVERKIIPIVKEKIRFWVVDVAEYAQFGAWRVVELNDGQMSGLSCVEPDTLYRKMAKVLRGE